MSGAVAAAAAMKKGNVVISAGSGGQLDATEFNPTDCVVQITFESDCDIMQDGSTTVDRGDWMTPKLG